MFERYTERARRVIFFARYEASQLGSPYIEPEHLLLGILRERRSLNFRLPAGLNLEQARREFQALSPVREKFSVSVDIPLTQEAKRVLAYSAEEAERLAHSHIDTQHLFLALLREPSPACEMLRKHRFDLEGLRNESNQAGAQAARGETNRDIVNALRDKFEPIRERLTPEIEPAAVYSLHPRNGERDRC